MRLVHIIDSLYVSQSYCNENRDQPFIAVYNIWELAKIICYHRTYSTSIHCALWEQHLLDDKIESLW